MPEEVKKLARRSSCLVLKWWSGFLLFLLAILTSLTGCWWDPPVMYGPAVMYGPVIQPLYGVPVGKFVMPDQTPGQDR
jgi:hypothetical protein